MIGNSIAGFLGTGVAASTSSYESIATATGTGSSGTITFSSIAGTYSALQLRFICRNGSTSTNVNDVALTFNGVTSTASYASHFLQGNGTTATAGGQASGYPGYIIITGLAPENSNLASTMGVAIIDVLDYASTTKNKTARIFRGLDMNGATGQKVGLDSGLFISTTAISSLTLTSTGGNWTTASTFALYGIKG